MGANCKKNVSARRIGSVRNVTAKCVRSMTVQSQSEFESWPRLYGQNSNLLIVLLIH